MTDPDHRQTAARMASVCLTEQGDRLRDLGNWTLRRVNTREPSANLGNRNDRSRRGHRKIPARHRAPAAAPLRRRPQSPRRSARDLRGAGPAGSRTAALAPGSDRVHEQESRALRRGLNRLPALPVHGSADRKRTRRGRHPQPTRSALQPQYPSAAEDAVAFFLQAAEIYADPAIADSLKEGRARSNAAATLIFLGRHARRGSSYSAPLPEGSLWPQCRAVDDLGHPPQPRNRRWQPRRRCGGPGPSHCRLRRRPPQRLGDHSLAQQRNSAG